MWYYRSSNEQKGPVGAEQMADLIRAGTVSHETMVWQEGMDDWLPARATELSGQLGAAPPPAPMAPAVPSMVRPASEAKTLETWFLVLMICAGVSGGLGFISQIIAMFTYSGLILIPSLLGWAGGIAAVVFSILMLYKFWHLIPTEKAATTPGKAIGFMFIPFFNLYWAFIAIYELGLAFNREMAEKAPEGRKINMNMVRAYCVAIAFSFGVNMMSQITFFQGMRYYGHGYGLHNRGGGFASFLVALIAAGTVVLAILSYRDLKDAAVSLIRKREA